MSTISAHIVVRGAAAAAQWYQRAFGAREVGRIPVPDGRLLEVRLRFGDDEVHIADEFPELGVLSPLSVGGTYGALHIATDDADTLWRKAIDAGATVHQPIADAFWGERHGQLLDPYGHRWGISQHLRDVSDEEKTSAAAELFR